MTRPLADERPMDFDAFLAFVDARASEERWELRDGIPDMTPAPVKRHQIMVMNLLRLLDRRRDEGTSWLALPGLGVRIPSALGRAVVPDVVVVAEGDPATGWIVDPLVAIEVLSPSTRGVDLGWKPTAYREVPSLRHLVLVDPDQPWVMLQERATGWAPVGVTGLDGAVGLSSIDAKLPMRDLYRDVAL